MNKYLLGTGYHEREGSFEFAKIWRENAVKAHPNARILCIADSGAIPPYPKEEVISLTGDIGHIGDLLHGRKQYEFCGWTMVVLTLALLAYQDERDFIFREQDVLEFGGTLFQMERQIGNAGIIFGKSELHACAQSLFLIKHWYLPEFVRQYLSTGPENHKDNVGEIKFRKLMAENAHAWTQFDLGVDRERPLPFNAPNWYCQQLTKEELDELRKRGLI